jgi:hypothetical protein
MIRMIGSFKKKLVGRLKRKVRKRGNQREKAKAEKDKYNLISRKEMKVNPRNLSHL